MSDPLRIATRRTEVALRRARLVQASLAQRGVASELVPIRTSGDWRFDQPVAGGGGRDAFAKELHSALRRKRADLAVQALPDVPTELPRGIVIAAVTSRGDPRDALVVNELIEARALADLPRGTRVGASSVRTRSLLLALHPQIEVVHLRGDLPTRLRKVEQGQAHATVVPAASLALLDVTQQVAALLDPETWLPPPGQGAIAIETRAEDTRSRDAVAPLHDERTALDTSAERALAHALEGGPQSPLCGAVVADGTRRILRALLVDLQGRRLVRGERPMEDGDPALVGIRLANELRARGASAILDELRAAQWLPATQPE